MKITLPTYPWSSFFKTGALFPVFLIILLPVLTQEEGCGGKNYPPDPPELPSACTLLGIPGANAQNVAVTTKLRWPAAPDNPLGYKLRMGTSTGSGDLLDNVDVGNVTSYTPTERLPGNTTIYVTVTPYNAEGDVTGCKEISFTTGEAPTIQPPACPQLTSPTNGARDVPIDARLEWTDVPNAETFELSIEHRNLDMMLVDEVRTADNFYRPPDPWKENTTYNITINAINAAGASQQCQSFSFSTEGPPLPCPELVNLTDGAEDIPLDFVLQWGIVDPAQSFQVEIIRRELDMLELLDEVTVGSSNMTLNELDLSPYLRSDNDYRVRVSPINISGEISSCSSVSFSTISTLPSVPPNCTQLRIPADGASNVQVNQTLNWERADGATGYRVSVGTSAGQNDLAEVVALQTVLDLEDELPLDTRIFVRIIPFNEAGDATGCAEESFQTLAGNVRPDEPRVRRNVSDLAPNDPIIQTYREGVSRMRALPSDHPHNWFSQVNIHRDHCQHGSWFFLPWHRAYLFYFEEAIRELTGDDTWALPYWDWAQNPEVPAVFWGNNNPLTHSRNVGPNDAPWARNTTPAVINDILGIQAFELFASGEANAGRFQGATGRLEGTPHNIVHSRMGQNMGDANMAANDPIFWLHHANVDRLWAEWNEIGNANTNRGAWLNQPFNDHFWDQDGNFIDVRVSDVVSTYDMGYRYDTQEASPLPTAFAAIPIDLIPVEDLVFTQQIDEPRSTAEPLEITFAANARFFEKLSAIAQQDPEMLADESVRLYLEGIKPPMNGEIMIDVFINHENLTADTPISDPHYVTTFSFFLPKGDQEHSGGGHEHHSTNSSNFVIDLSDTLRKLRGTDSFPQDELTIQLLAIPISGDSGDLSFTPGEVSVVIFEL